MLAADGKADVESQINIEPKINLEIGSETYAEGQDGNVGEDDVEEVSDEDER